jgi:hypothetical protein
MARCSCPEHGCYELVVILTGGLSPHAVWQHIRPVHAKFNPVQGMVWFKAPNVPKTASFRSLA